MPRRFSDSQMVVFKDKLIAAGFAALETTGVRKTTVEDLARVAGLSTGAFYRFFPTKEALFFAVYEIAEERLKAEFITAIQNTREVSSLTLRRTLKQLLRSATAQALLRLMRQEELDYLLRSLDPILVEQHLKKDNEFLQQVIEQLRASGLKSKMEVGLLLDYLQALLVLCQEKHLFSSHADQIIDAFIDTLVTEAIGS